MAEQQEQRQAAGLGTDSRVAAYRRIIAPYQRNPQYALSDAERQELTAQLNSLLLKGCYIDAKSKRLVRLVSISSQQGDRAIDFCVNCEHTDGTPYSNSVEFFIEMHRFTFTDSASW